MGWAKTIGYKKPGKKVAEKNEAPNATVGGEVKKQKVKSKKKRKPRYPKNYKPGEDNGPIDTERWLPLRSRSYYKGKRRDKKSKIGKGNQGTAGMSKITEQLDRSKQTAPVNSPKATRAADSP